jgi:hypothetical protein
MISERDKEQAQQDGYISCTECGHDIMMHVFVGDPDDEGCMHLDCGCTVEFTAEQIIQLYVNYGIFPYRIGARCEWALPLSFSEPGVGVVVSINVSTGAVTVDWGFDHPYEIDDPVENLVEAG